MEDVWIARSRHVYISGVRGSVGAVHILGSAVSLGFVRHSCVTLGHCRHHAHQREKCLRSQLLL